MQGWRCAGAAVPAVAFISIAVSIALSPGFSWTDKALSDLGVGDSHSVIFNVGLIASGLLVLLFSAGILRDASEEMKAIGWLTSPVGLFLTCVGVFNENFGTLHFLFSVLFFLSLAAGVTLSALIIRRRARRTAVLMLLATAVAVLSWLLPTTGIVRGVAIPEAISSAIGGVWIAYLALGLVKE
jgi:hypothetical membrane protein